MLDGLPSQHKLLDGLYKESTHEAVQHEVGKFNPVLQSAVDTVHIQLQLYSQYDQRLSVTESSHKAHKSVCHKALNSST
jgi:hypothetical protein